LTAAGAAAGVSIAGQVLSIDGGWLAMGAGL
jgi:hypothetical protein